MPLLMETSLCAPSSSLFKKQPGTSLGVQWTRVRSLVQENPSASEQPSPCSTTSEPLLQSPGAASTEARAPRGHTQQQEKPPSAVSLSATPESSPRAPRLEKARVQRRRSSTATSNH